MGSKGFGMAKFVGFFFFDFLSFEGICGALDTLDPPVEVGSRASRTISICACLILRGTSRCLSVR